MKINIHDIPEAGLVLDFKDEGKNIEELAGRLDFSFLSPVSAHLEISSSEGMVNVNGDLRARLLLGCSRCLKEFQSDIDTDFSVIYMPGNEKETEKELKPGDLEVNYLDGHELDTTEILLAQLSLEVPIKPLCREDCKGLCPKCGADLNASACACVSGEEAKTDSRFAKLKDFKVK